MLRTERYAVFNMENAIRGARNAMNSWARMDSTYAPDGSYILGQNDLSLARKLCAAGSDHRKFLRQIMVCVDITGPLYWWKEFDTYKVGTVANSTSTMHKIHSKPFALEDFSHDHLDANSLEMLHTLMDYLETQRTAFVAGKDKTHWWQMIQLLPSSYNQMRTCTMNYENLRGMYSARKAHKLDEWRTFCAWVETLPYAQELICGNEKNG